MEKLHGICGKTLDALSMYLELVAADANDQAAVGEDIIELYGHLRPSLEAYLGSRGLNEQHSEDVIQEVFLRLVRHTLKQGARENLKAWIFRVAHNLSMDYHRSHKRLVWGDETETAILLRDRVDPSPNPEQKIILEERARQLRLAMAQLTPKQRHALRLRAQGLRYQQIALVMGVSVQRVGELMQRAISRVEFES